MGCGGWILWVIVSRVFLYSGFPRGVWLGIGVGAVAGLIVALVRGDWFHILWGCMWGFLGGLVFQLVIVMIERRENKRRFGK